MIFDYKNVPTQSYFRYSCRYCCISVPLFCIILLYRAKLDYMPFELRGDDGERREFFFIFIFKKHPIVYLTCIPKLIAFLLILIVSILPIVFLFYLLISFLLICRFFLPTFYISSSVSLVLFFHL